MRRATRLLMLSVAAVLAASAVSAQACDRAKAASATAASCNTKSCPAGACAAHGMTAAKKSGVTAGAAKKASVTRNAAVAAPKKAVPATAGMRAYRDPETGTFGPPTVTGIGEDGVVVVKDSPVVLQEVPIPGGGYAMDLQGTGEDYVTMKIDAKGNRVVTCAPARSAKKPVAAKAAPTSTAFPEK